MAEIFELHTTDAELPEKLVSAVSHEAAMQAVFEQPPHMVFGSQVFAVDNGWHVAALREDQHVRPIQDVHDLQTALNERDDAVLFVSQKCGISFAALEAMLRYSTGTHIVVYELKRAA